MIRRLAVLCTLGALACGKSPALPAHGPAGKVNLDRIGIGVAPGATGAPAAPNVCGTFTLQPYSIDGNGNTAMAGLPVTVTSTYPATPTSAILGCIDSQQSPAKDWGYLVTATDFQDCSTGLPIPGLAPAVVTQSFPIDCQAGVDVSLPISVDVAIAVPNAAGYIDINTTVSATAVPVGCKQADVDSGGNLHFGETQFYPAAPAPLGFLGIGSHAPLASGPNQFAGIINAGSQFGAYYTGLLPISANVTDLLQTFVSKACGPREFYAATQAPQCDTEITQIDKQGGLGVTTAAQLSDAFILVPGDIWVSARIASTRSIHLTYGTSAQLSNANPAVTTAWNPSRHQELIYPFDVIGVYVGLQQPGTLLVAVANGPSYQTVSYDPGSGSWTSGLFQPVDGLSSLQMQAMGLFQSIDAGCHQGNQVPYTVGVDLSHVITASSAALGIDAASLCLKVQPRLREQLLATRELPKAIASGFQELAAPAAPMMVRAADLPSGIWTVQGLHPRGTLAVQAQLHDAYPCGTTGTSAPVLGGYPADLGSFELALDPLSPTPAAVTATPDLVFTSGASAFGWTSDGPVTAQAGCSNGTYQLDTIAPLPAGPISDFSSQAFRALGFGVQDALGGSNPLLLSTQILTAPNRWDSRATFPVQDQLMTSGRVALAGGNRLSPVGIGTGPTSSVLPAGRQLQIKFATAQANASTDCDPANPLLTSFTLPAVSTLPRGFAIETKTPTPWVYAEKPDGETALITTTERAEGSGFVILNGPAQPLVNSFDLSAQAGQAGIIIEGMCGSANLLSRFNTSLTVVAAYRYAGADGLARVESATLARASDGSWQIATGGSYQDYLTCAAATNESTGIVRIVP